MTNTPPPVAALAAIILAAGKGTRMKSATHKVLHPIAGRPMLLHLMAAVAKLGAAQTVVVVGDKGEQVRGAVGAHAAIAVQEPQLGTGHAVQQGQAALTGFDGDVLILYGDVPLVRAETMHAMIARLNAPDAPAVVVLAFSPEDPLHYGRVICDGDRITKMVEYKDATETERACATCNSGLMAVKARDLFALLARVTDDNAAKEFYLVDIVNIANADGRHSAVVIAEEWEVAGVNSRAELAALEAVWQGRRRAQAMADGVTLIAPETVWFTHDTQLSRDVTVGSNVVFGPGSVVHENVVIHSFSHLQGCVV
ncbi:MAG: NTP transferase domain-containing protein, partial [Alphaproteobacteria bacterium]|nr:NTP transferase domain-containing protein [Alphaproteobacteria bacterium]